MAILTPLRLFASLFCDRGFGDSCCEIAVIDVYPPLHFPLLRNFTISLFLLFIFIFLLFSSSSSLRPSSSPFLYLAYLLPLPPVCTFSFASTFFSITSSTSPLPHPLHPCTSSFFSFTSSSFSSSTFPSLSTPSPLPLHPHSFTSSFFFITFSSL